MSDTPSSRGLVARWRASVRENKPAVRYLAPAPFESIDIRPGRMVLLGGAPGAGKTAAMLQLGIGIVQSNPDVRLLIANAEMAPDLLFDRMASRMSGVPLSAITDRTMTAEQVQTVDTIGETIEGMSDRLLVLESPSTIEEVAHAATEFQANVLIFDYLQIFTLGEESDSETQTLKRISIALRQFCFAGAAVIAAVAVARQKSASGSSTYAGLSLASLRGSSALEYGADSVYLFGEPIDGITTFQCAKNRNGAPVDIAVRFRGDIQRFDPAPVGLASFGLASREGVTNE